MYLKLKLKEHFVKFHREIYMPCDVFVVGNHDNFLEIATNQLFWKRFAQWIQIALMI